MIRVFGFKKKIIVLLICSLLLTLVLAGCRKKEQPKPTPAEPAMQKKEINMPPSPNDMAPPPPAGSSHDTNRPKTIKSTGKEMPKSMMSKKLPAAVESNTMATDELTLNKYDSIVAPEDKIDFINEFTSEHPEAVADLAKKALDDKDLDVRAAAMDAFVTGEPQGPAAMEVLDKAITDSEEQIRLSAVEACGNLDMPETGKILAQAVADESDSVREAAIQTADDKDPDTRLSVLKAGLNSKYPDTKETAISSLSDMPSPTVVDILIPVLKDPNPDTRDAALSTLDSLLPREQELTTYDQWNNWWKKNRNKYDEDLNEKEN